jgi:FkbM family methyltransferase
VLDVISRINRLPVWRRSVRLWDCDIVPSSLDRLAALLLHRAGWMGQEASALFRSHLRAGMTVVDVGANQGIYTLLLSRLVGGTGKVYAFEPEPVLYGCALANCRRNGATNVELLPYALGAQKGHLHLDISSLNTGDNRIRRDASAGTRVEVRPLDSLIRGQVDFIKIDVQGWEFEVLRGMTRILEENPRIVLCFEFWPYGLRAAGEDPLDLLRYLETRGFVLREVQRGGVLADIDPAALLARLSGTRYTNLLAARPSK